MDDGYYLATYLNPAGIHRIANVRLRHDHNISLWEKRGSEVRLLRHWVFERISGQKTHRTPFASDEDQRRFIERLLGTVGLRLTDMQEIWGTPGLDTAHDYDMTAQYPDIAFHSISHLFSAVLMRSAVFFDENIIGLAVDRGPDRLVDRVSKPYWYAGCTVRQGQVDIVPVESPGVLYCEARDNFRLREGTLMALAGATEAAGVVDRDALAGRHYFGDTDVIEQSRAVFRAICRQVEDSYRPDDRFTAHESFMSAVMKEVQAVSVLIMERNVDRLLARSGLRSEDCHLALAGGYALNCPTNSHLMDKYGFKSFLAPPSVGDDGQSVGIGLVAFRNKIRGRFSYTYPGPYLGREDSRLSACLDQYADHILGVQPATTEVVLDDLEQGPVGWFEGASEVGPRALGNRSLLGDPRRMETKTRLNDLKGRQWWRPVAPVVLERELASWFERSRPSPYMLETFTIREEVRSLVPAIAHLDFSARVQSVTAAQNGPLCEILEAFLARTGVPMLCNTSFNGNGEPIVDALPEAFHFCLAKDLRVMYANGMRLEFKPSGAFADAGPLQRDSEPFKTPSELVKAAIAARQNPHGLAAVELYLYLYDLPLCDAYDIRKPQDATVVQDILRKRMAADPAVVQRAVSSMRKNELHFEAFGWQPLIPEHMSVEDIDQIAQRTLVLSSRP